MAGMVFFTDNYQDRSTRDGYQFEFYCRRCGNGYPSSFQHSSAASAASCSGWAATCSAGDRRARRRSWAGTPSSCATARAASARDKALAKAVDEMKPYFNQCHRCGQWVCGQICWNTERGLCTTCAPKLDQEIAGMQAEAQVDQLHSKIQDVRTGRRTSTTATRAPDVRELRPGDRGGKFCN